VCADVMVCVCVQMLWCGCVCRCYGVCVCVDIMVVYAQIRCNQLGRAVRTLMESEPTANQGLLPIVVSVCVHVCACGTNILLCVSRLIKDRASAQLVSFCVCNVSLDIVSFWYNETSEKGQ